MNPCLRTACLQDVLDRRVHFAFRDVPYPWRDDLIDQAYQKDSALKRLYDAEARLRRK